MIRYILLFTCILAAALSTYTVQAAGLNPAVKANIKELIRLDSLLERQPELSERKEKEIESLRKALSRTGNINEQIRLLNKLFEEYRYYDSDSALKYSRLMYDFSQQMQPRNDSLSVSFLIDQAYMYSIQGFHDKAKKLLDRIPQEMIGITDIGLKYYKAREYGASMELVYAIDNKENTDHIWKHLLQYRDSLKILSKDLPNRYPWISIAEKLEGSDPREVDAEALDRLRLSVDTVSDVAGIDAPSAYWLARYYNSVGDSIRMIHYLAVASQSKILNQYRENPAMPELASHLFDYGDLERAYNYIMYSGQQINSYKNRNRIVLNTSIISDVKDAYSAKLKERDRMLCIYMVGLIVFAVLLVIFILALINRNKKLHKTQRKLFETNSELVDALGQRDEAIESLKTANDRLGQLNRMKHEVIALAFHLAAIQIGRLDEFRKKLLRKYKANQFAQLGTYLNDDEIIKEYYTDLNKAFDKTVISTFPEFIEDYNNSCGEAARVDIEEIVKTQTLNVRLRIYALRRLGIEKSADLAQILNVSIRTVYNNRSTDPKSASTEAKNT